MAASDRHLVEQALAGDPSAFGDLAERYAGLVRGVVWEALRRPDEVDDVVQEVFGHAYAHLGTLRRHDRFVPWLWQIAANAVVDHQRQRQRCEAGPTGPEAGLALHLRRPDQVVEEDDASRLIWEALDRLEPRRRRIVVLYYFEQCPQRQIARFLGLSVPSVKVDLLKARRQLRDDLFVLLGEEVQARRQSRHRLREKLMAVLPVSPFLRPAPPTGWIARAGGWVGLPLALAASLGLHGLLGLGVSRLSPVPGTSGSQGGAIRIRFAEPRPMAATAQARPERPRPGETVQLEVPGAGLTGPGQRAFVHYVTSPLATVESVVPMKRQGDRWVAEVRLPAGAVALFYAVSDQAAPQELRPFSGDSGWMRQLGQYRGSVLAHNPRGRPVRDAEYTAAEMALMAGRPFAEVKTHLDRETALYPDNVRAWNEGWFQALRIDSTARARVQSEQRSLMARFADRPEVLYALGQAAGPGLPEAYPELRRRFPGYPRTAELAYLWSRYYALERDTTGQWTMLEEVIRAFPGSRYARDARADLAAALVHRDPDRAVRLADSLIDGQSRPEEISANGWASETPEGRAYLVRFELYLRQGDTAGALALARRLAGSGLQDPLVYRSLGERLAQGGAMEYWPWGRGGAVSCPRDPELAAQVLEGGLPMVGLAALQARLKGRSPLLGPALALEQAASQRGAYLQSLGACYLAQGRFARAVTVLQEAVGLVQQGSGLPRDEQGYLLLGRAREGAGDPQEARMAYARALAMVGSQPEAEAALARLYAAQVGSLDGFPIFLSQCRTTAPDFALTDVRGQGVRLSNLAGRPVLLFYERFFASPFAAGAMPVLQAWQRQYGGELAVLYVASGILDPAAFTELARAQAGDLRVILDDGSVYRGYRPGYREAILVDRYGKIRLRRGWGADAEEEIRRQVEAILAEPFEEGMVRLLVQGGQTSLQQ